MNSCKYPFAVILTVSSFLLFRCAEAQSKNELSVYTLWTGGDVPKKADLVELKNVQFRSIKKYEPQKDGYRFLHGVAIARYHNRWMVTFGHNKGPENTGSEEARSTSSKDGKKWEPMLTIDDPAGDQASSHGVLLNYRDTLWSFNASFTGIMRDLFTNAFTWDDKKAQWVFMGRVAGEGFWPLQEPIQMKNGEWIMSGASVNSDGKDAGPAVAICKDGNFRYWEVKIIPVSAKVWGESSVIVDGARVMLISRSSVESPRIDGYSFPLAWISLSDDYGQTWSELQPSNMPMAATKPYTGILSNGQRYLIASSSKDSDNWRDPLTIAMSKPGENSFSKIYCIRRAVKVYGEVESHQYASLAYPYAVEYKGALYVVYSNSGDRLPTDRSNWNNNSAEMAIIPIKELVGDGH